MDYQNQIVREDMCELAKEHLPFEKLKGSSVPCYRSIWDARHLYGIFFYVS